MCWRPARRCTIAGYTLRLDGVAERAGSELLRRARRRSTCCATAATIAVMHPGEARLSRRRSGGRRDGDPHHRISPTSMSRWATSASAAAGWCAPMSIRWRRSSGSAARDGAGRFRRACGAGCACAHAARDRLAERRRNETACFAAAAAGARRRCAAAAARRIRCADPALEARARALQKELRCLVCQGESLDEFERAARRRPATPDPRADRGRRHRRRRSSVFWSRAMAISS